MDAKRNTQEEYDAYDQVNNDPRLVDTDFIENQGLSAKATNFETKKIHATNDARFLEEQAANEEQYQREALLEQEQVNKQIAFARRQAVQMQQSRAKGGSKARGASAFGRWIGIGIAGTAYFWQFVFALISLIGFFAKGAISHILNGTTIGKVVNKFVGFFFDIEKLFPIEYLAMAFWGLATIIALGTFFAFLLLFFFTGVKILRGPLSLLITAITFASCIIPVANLFPVVLLWIIYVNATASADMLRGFKT